MTANGSGATTRRRARRGRARRRCEAAFRASRTRMAGRADPATAALAGARRSASRRIWATARWRRRAGDAVVHEPACCCRAGDALGRRRQAAQREIVAPAGVFEFIGAHEARRRRVRGVLAVLADVRLRRPGRGAATARELLALLRPPQATVAPGLGRGATPLGRARLPAPTPSAAVPARRGFSRPRRLAARALNAARRARRPCALQPRRGGRRSSRRGRNWPPRLLRGQPAREVRGAARRRCSRCAAAAHRLAARAALAAAGAADAAGAAPAPSAGADRPTMARGAHAGGCCHDWPREWAPAQAADGAAALAASAPVCGDRRSTTPRRACGAGRSARALAARRRTRRAGAGPWPTTRKRSVACGAARGDARCRRAGRGARARAGAADAAPARRH
ncbi:MAG: hypothetical protein MZW92_57560 [Comamonadaceae bacterium]|nr:hypothetical protein [Comamonadaceae bacterium]